MKLLDEETSPAVAMLENIEPRFTIAASGAKVALQVEKHDMIHYGS